MVVHHKVWVHLAFCQTMRDHNTLQPWRKPRSSFASAAEETDGPAPDRSPACPTRNLCPTVAPRCPIAIEYRALGRACCPTRLDSLCWQRARPWRFARPRSETSPPPQTHSLAYRHFNRSGFSSRCLVSHRRYPAGMHLGCCASRDNGYGCAHSRLRVLGLQVRIAPHRPARLRIESRLASIGLPRPSHDSSLIRAVRPQRLGATWNSSVLPNIR